MSATKKPAAPASVAELRNAIADLKAEIQEVDNAGLPASECEAALRQVLAEAGMAFDAMKRRAAECLAIGEMPTLQFLAGNPVGPNGPTQIALGAALAAYGPDRFIKEAREAADGAQGLRMTAAQRLEKLRNLRRHLYELELAEEEIIEQTGEARRPDVSAAAVLGLPLDVVEDTGLLGKKGA